MNKSANELLTIGLLCINTGMNLSRARHYDGNRIANDAETSPDTAIGWELLPYQTGLLQVYTQAHAADPGRYKFRLPLHRRRSVEDSVAELRGTSIVGFSTYIWN